MAGDECGPCQKDRCQAQEAAQAPAPETAGRGPQHDRIVFRAGPNRIRTAPWHPAPRRAVAARTYQRVVLEEPDRRGVIAGPAPASLCPPPGLPSSALASGRGCLDQRPDFETPSPRPAPVMPPSCAAVCSCCRSGFTGIPGGRRRPGGPRRPGWSCAGWPPGTGLWAGRRPEGYVICRPIWSACASWRRGSRCPGTCPRADRGCRARSSAAPGPGASARAAGSADACLGHLLRRYRDACC